MNNRKQVATALAALFLAVTAMLAALSIESPSLDRAGTEIFGTLTGEAEPTVEQNLPTFTALPATTDSTCRVIVGQNEFATEGWMPSGAAEKIYRDHNTSSVILNSVAPGTEVALTRRFVYTDVVDEWWYAPKYSGWFRNSANFAASDQKFCWDIPTETFEAVPTLLPTATAQATFTPVGKVYVCPGPGISGVNIRETPSLTGVIKGVLAAGGRIEYLNLRRDGWYALANGWFISSTVVVVC